MRALVASILALSALQANVAGADVRFHGEAGGTYSVAVTSWRDMPFREVVRQQYDFSCGSAAVATLLRFHYGQPVTEADAFRAMFAAGDQARIRQAGFSMLDMKQYLESLGYRADGFRMPLDALARANAPGIALIRREGYLHFVVIKGVSETSVLVGDPNFGLRTFPRAQFESWWNGIVLAIRSGPGADGGLRFNDAQAWRPRPTATPGELVDRATLGLPALDLPTLYQITPAEPAR